VIRGVTIRCSGSRICLCCRRAARPEDGVVTSSRMASGAWRCCSTNWSASSGCGESLGDSLGRLPACRRKASWRMAGGLILDVPV